MATEFAPVWTGPSGGAWTYHFLGSRPHAPTFMDDDYVIFSAQAAAGATPAQLFCINLRTRHDLWVRTRAGEWTSSPSHMKGIVCIGNADGHLYAFQPSTSTGGDAWPRFNAAAPVTTKPLYIGSQVFFGTSAGDFYGVSFDLAKKTRTQMWRSASPFGAVSEVRPTPAANLAGYVVFARTDGASSVITAMIPDSNRSKLTLTLPNEVVTSDPVIANGLAFFGFASGRLLGLDFNGVIKVDVSLPAPLLGALAADSEYVYGAGADGTFYAQPVSGIFGWRLPITHTLPSGIVLHGGSAYFAGADPQGKSDFYSLDLFKGPDQVPAVVVQSVQGRVDAPPALHGSGLLAFIASEAAAGTVYVFHGGDTEMLARVKFSSTLIAGDYSLEGETEKPRRPEYQIAINVTDANDISEAGVSVAMWASNDETVIGTKNGEVKLKMTPENAHHEITDGNGQILLTMAGDLGTASLFLRPAFFTDGYAMQVFPDLETVTRLSALDGEHLKSATSAYSGQAVLKTHYQDNASSVAATIRNAVGPQHNVSSARLVKLSQPGSATATVAGGATSAAPRGIAPGEVEHWTLELDEANVTFGPATPAEIDRINAALFATTTVSFGFHDFVKDVTKGAHKVKNMTWKHVKNGAERSASVVAEAFHGEERKIYEFAVTAVEHAVDVVKGVIKDVVTAIDTFVEWLSWLFDWDAILATKKQIEDQTRSMLVRLSTAAKNPETGAKMKAALETLRDSFNANFAEGVKQLTGLTVSSTQQRLPSKHELLHPHGFDVTAQLSWLLRKLEPSKIVFEPSPEDEKLLDEALQKFVQEMQALLTGEFAALADAFTNCVNAFLALVEGPSTQLLKQFLTTIAETFEETVDLLLDFLIKAVDALAALFAGATDAVIRILEANIHAGYVSELYKKISGSDLRLLDLGALIVAVPATIIHTLMQSGAANSLQSQTAAKADDLQLYLMIEAALAFLDYGGLAVIEVDLDEAKGEGNLVRINNAGQGTMNALITALTCESLLTDPEAPEGVNVFFTLLQMLPTFINCYVIGDPTPRSWQTPAWLVLGEVNVVISSVFVVWPKDYLDPDYMTLIQNLGTAIPYFTAIPELKEFREAKIGMNAFGYFAGTATSVVMAAVS